MNNKMNLYRTPASLVRAGWTFRDLGVLLTITKCYTLSDGSVVIHDSSGMVKQVAGTTLIDIMSGT